MFSYSPRFPESYAHFAPVMDGRDDLRMAPTATLSLVAETQAGEGHRVTLADCTRVVPGIPLHPGRGVQNMQKG